MVGFMVRGVAAFLPRVQVHYGDCDGVTRDEWIDLRGFSEEKRLELFDLVTVIAMYPSQGSFPYFR
jgi:hypothetical protein